MITKQNLLKIDYDTLKMHIDMRCSGMDIHDRMGDASIVHAWMKCLEEYPTKKRWEEGLRWVNEAATRLAEKRIYIRFKA